MYNLPTNEKLGRSVEDLRLREIRQQVELQRIAATARTAWFKRVSRPIIISVQMLMTHLFSS